MYVSHIPFVSLSFCSKMTIVWLPLFLCFSSLFEVLHATHGDSDPIYRYLNNYIYIYIWTYSSLF